MHGEGFGGHIPLGIEMPMKGLAGRHAIEYLDAANLHQPIAGQIESEAGKWGVLARPPIFAAVSPYLAAPDTVTAVGAELKARGAAAILLDCIGFTERHRAALAGLAMPVILSNAVVAKAVGELFGG